MRVACHAWTSMYTPSPCMHSRGRRTCPFSRSGADIGTHQVEFFTESTLSTLLHTYIDWRIPARQEHGSLGRTSESVQLRIIGNYSRNRICRVDLHRSNLIVLFRDRGVEFVPAGLFQTQPLMTCLDENLPYSSTPIRSSAGYP